MPNQAARERMHSLLQAELADLGVLAGWVVVAEIMLPDGTMQLRRVKGPDTCPSWRWRGYLHDATDESRWEQDDDEDGTP